MYFYNATGNEMKKKRKDGCLFCLFDFSSAYEEGYQNQGPKPNFWETFGSNSALSDNNVERSSEAQSNNKNSAADGWDTWDNDWEKAGDDKDKKSTSKVAVDSWDNSGW